MISNTSGVALERGTLADVSDEHHLSAFAKRVQQAMHHARIRRAVHLEEEAGLAKGSLSRLFTGGRQTLRKHDQIEAVAKACGVSVEWLMTGRGSMLLPAAPVGAAQVVVESDVTPWERALATAFRGGDFELRDLEATKSATRDGGARLKDAPELVRAATRWLHAAKALRLAGEEITVAALMLRLAGAADESRQETENARANAELQAVGGERPLAPVPVPRRKGLPSGQ